MKIAVITDTHIGARSGNKVIEESQRRFFDNVFFPTLKEEGIGTVLHGGDIFDTRQTLDAQSFSNASTYFFDPLQDFQTYAIPGNHDIYYRNKIEVNHLTTFLTKICPNINIMMDIGKIELGGKNFLLVPWIVNSTYEDYTKRLLKDSADVVLGHFDIAGFTMQAGEVSKNGMDRSIFEGYPRVWSGHFHEPSEQGNIRYLGAANQITWADYGSPRGFHIYDTENDNLRAVYNPYEIFTRVVYDDKKMSFEEISGNDPDWFDQYENRYVKIIIKNADDKVSYKEFFSAIDKVAYDVRVEDLTEFDISGSELMVEDFKETEDIIREYVASVEGDFDNVAVLDIINSNLMKLKVGE